MRVSETALTNRCVAEIKDPDQARQKATNVEDVEIKHGQRDYSLFRYIRGKSEPQTTHQIV